MCTSPLKTNGIWFRCIIHYYEDINMPCTQKIKRQTFCWNSAKITLNNDTFCMFSVSLGVINMHNCRSAAWEITLFTLSFSVIIEIAWIRITSVGIKHNFIQLSLKSCLVSTEIRTYIPAVGEIKIKLQLFSAI